MSVNAYILINVAADKIPEVVARLQALPGGIVREVVGPFDVVVELEADTEEDLTAILRHQINPISGITHAATCTWFVRDVSGLGEGRSGGG